jgi:outer membrane murein-binding lipoprotein Lpp
MAKALLRRNITFELPPTEYQALQEDAEARGSGSLHQRAREIITDSLSNRDIDELSEQVAIVDANVAHLSELLRRVAYSVLVHAAGKESKEANAWIREHMPSSGNT